MGRRRRHCIAIPAATPFRDRDVLAGRRQPLGDPAGLRQRRSKASGRASGTARRRAAERAVARLNEEEAVMKPTTNWFAKLLRFAGVILITLAAAAVAQTDASPDRSADVSPLLT